MSTEASSWAWRQSPLSAGEKLTLAAAADNADQYGVTYIGQAALAEKCSTTKRTIGTHLRALEARGLVARRERRRKNGSRTSDWIVLAPGAADRGEMKDASPDEFASMIVELARSEEKSSREESARGQRKNQGGPEPSEEPPAPSPDGEGGARDLVRDVFEHWVEAFGLGDRVTLTPERRRKVRERLKRKTPEQIKGAIDRVAADPWRREGPMTRRDLELICRTDTKLEQFMVHEPSENGSGRQEARQRRTREGLQAIERLRGSK